ncbi:MAG TPA: ATPase [Methanocorpusculum sp.]|nr:ATPase [Methanocorpusculum sp.]
MKTEVLKSIKEAEAKSKSSIQAAEKTAADTKSKAQMEAETLIASANTAAEDYKKQKLNDAKNEAAAKHAKVVEEGKAHAAKLTTAGSAKLPQAVSLFVERFKEKLHVSA